ncbi:putative cyclic nucleotide-gated ion channel 13 isoform A [Glycine soja]|uniref:Putative cyclic nucleotide-gated ion channel 13 isoform A n=1 Tax=Glycine soja TaxID=3848 RepID=A0A445LH93_GLYSO|nr:putative cyclic nucleotide-gated ion channel 13 isoform A [Glycine soja]
MLFIMSRKVSSVTTNGGRTGFFNSLFLMAGDFCGEEILIWASDPSSSSKLPISTRTVQTISEVEAFALMSEDLKLLASEFRNHGGKQLHHALRQGSIPGSRGHGLPVSYKQLGADTGKRRLRDTTKCNRDYYYLCYLKKPAEPDFTAQNH